VVPAPSANISSQFIICMEQYEGISRSQDLKRFASIGPRPAVSYSLHVSECRLQSFKVRIVGTLFCRNNRRCSLLARPVPGAYLTTRDTFHGHSQQPYTNSRSEEDIPNDLLTGQLIVKGIGSKYLDIRNTAAFFGTRLLPSRDPGTFPGHT